VSDRDEPSGKVRTFFLDFKAPSRSRQRAIGGKWTASPNGAVDQPQVRQAPSSPARRTATCARRPPPRTVFTLAFALSLSLSVRAAEKEKEQELKGEGCCLKCELKKADSCQNVISVKDKDGKSTLYVLEQNDVSKAFHSTLCKGTTKVVAKGVVKKQGDKHILVASKIEKADKGEAKK